jgi:hypothetical protein
MLGTTDALVATSYYWGDRWTASMFFVMLGLIMGSLAVYLFFQAFWKQLQGGLSGSVHEGMSDANILRLNPIIQTLETYIPVSIAASDYKQIQPYILNMLDASNALEVSKVDLKAFTDYRNLMKTNMESCMKPLQGTNSAKILEKCFQLFRTQLETFATSETSQSYY